MANGPSEFPDPPQYRLLKTRPALQIAGAYVLVASIWILFSDQLVGWLFPFPDQQNLAQSIKGFLFVLVTGGILYLHLRREFRRRVDITRHADTRYQHLLDHMLEGCQVIGFDWRYLYVNDAVAAQGRRGRDELLGHTMMDMYPGIDSTPLFDVLRRCMDERTPHFMENEFTYTDGDTGWFALSIQPVPEGLLIFSWDITERKQAQQALEESNRRIRRLAVRRAEVETTERRRLARELHDHVGQNLTALGINLNILLAQLPEDQEIARARLRDSLALIEETIEQTRDVMVNLRPPVLEDYGLAAVLRWYAGQFTARTQLPVAVNGEQLTPPIAPHLQDALFRIAQEAMNNAAKYARATSLTISVEAMPDVARLVVADNGVGFDAAATLAKGVTGHWGLQTMQERAELVGGTLRIESAPGQGTRVIAEVPR